LKRALERNPKRSLETTKGRRERTVGRRPVKKIMTPAWDHREKRGRHSRRRQGKLTLSR